MIFLKARRFHSATCVGLAIIIVFCAILCNSVFAEQRQESKSKLSSSPAKDLRGESRSKLSPKLQRILHTNKINARTFSMFDRVFESFGLNSLTWVPGLRSLMDMNNNGTQMEFVPLGRILWNRIFGDSATNTILGL